MPSCLVLFHQPYFHLEAASTLLSERGLTIKPQSSKLLVSWQNGPQLSVFFANGEDVLRESQEIGNSTGYTGQFDTFDTRFEIAFENLDEVLDEINTLIEVQTTLQEATRGFLFNSWNGLVTPPE